MNQDASRNRPREQPPHGAAQRAQRAWINNNAPGCVGLLDHCKYRYLAFLDGNTYSSRFKYNLLCGSTVLAQKQAWEEWFYPTLEPWVHYAEVAQGWTNAVEVFGKLQSKPGLAYAIAKAGQQYALKQFSQESVDCFLRELVLLSAEIGLVPDGDLPPQARPVEDVILGGMDVVVTSR